MKLVKHLLITFPVLALFVLCYIMIDMAYTVVAIMAWKVASLITALIFCLIVCAVLYGSYLLYKVRHSDNGKHERRNR